VELTHSRLQRRRKNKKTSLVGSILAYGLRIVLYFPLSLVIEPARVLHDLFQCLRHGRGFLKTFVAAVIWLACLAGVAFYLKSNPQLPWFIFAGALLLPRTWSWLLRPVFGLIAPPMVADEFYRSRKWRELRYDILRERGAVCELCGSQEAPLHVDHIRPRSKYPHLALDSRNLQVLCADCNVGKGVRHEDDFRAS
jgi:HNH endonuclease